MPQPEQTNNFQNALIELRSKNQDYKQAVVEQILHKSGLQQSNAINALHDTPHTSKASIAQAIYDPTDTERIKYAASWYGLYTNTPSTLIFHANESGPDSLYKFQLSGNGDDIRKNLDAHGIIQRVLIPTESGFHVLIYDQGRRLRANVAKLVQSAGINNLEETEGQSEFIGGKDPKSARENYRNNIKAFESKGNDAPNPK